MASPAERSMRWLVLAAILLPALVFVAGATLSYRQHFDDARERLSRTLDIAHEHAVKVFETVDLARSQIDQTVADLTDDEIKRQEGAVHRRLKSLTDSLDQVSGIYVFGASGEPLAAANYFPVPGNPNASAREYFATHRDEAGRDGVYVSERLVSLADRKTEFFIVSSRRTSSVPSPDEFRGVIAISVEPSYFRDFFATLSGTGLNTFAVIRSDGAILARYPETATPFRIPPASGFVRTTATSPERGTYEVFSAVDQVGRLYAYRRLPKLPVYVAFGIDRSTILAGWRATMANHLVFGLPATAGLVGLSLVALRRTRREALALGRVRDEIARREGTEAQLRQAQKMEAIGRLTGGLAHDFNNLLTIVIGSLDLASKRLPDGDPRLRKLVGNALDGAHRAARLTHRLLAFARQQPLDPKPLDVNRAVFEMADLIRRTLGETTRVETVLGGGVWRTKADANALESAILNLAVNARDAMPAGGRLTIETANAHLDDAYAAARTEVRAGQYVLVAVSDTGTGMPQSVIDRAFEPFFTTKEPGKGTGLGLSQVYGFAKQSDGHVALYSEEGRGTTIKLYLPRHVGTEDAEAANIDPVPDRSEGRLLVLLVEDEDGVRAVAADALRDLDYRVIEAPSGAAALKHLAAEPDIALMLTDVVMPDMDGRQVADQATAMRPGLKVVFMTGYTRNAVVHNGVLDPDILLISKPFTQAQLAAKLRVALDGPVGQTTEGERS